MLCVKSVTRFLLSLQVIRMPRPCGESDGYANPHDRIDRLGRVFAALKLRERYGITFERWLEMVERGTWGEWVA